MGELKTVFIPDIGDFRDVPVIEVYVQAGSQVDVEDPLLALESDKATIDIPAPFSGVIKEIKIKAGDKVSEGVPVAVIEVTDTIEGEPKAVEVSEKLDDSKTDELNKEFVTNAQLQQEVDSKPAQSAVEKVPQTTRPPIPALTESGEAVSSKAHAGPSVRRFARELGVNLDLITGSGPKQRIFKEDVQAFVKAKLLQIQMDSRNIAAGGTLELLPWPQVDFASMDR